MVFLRDGKTSEALTVKVWDEEGRPIPPPGPVSFSSNNPALIDVDAAGVVKGTGFGEAEITVTLQGLPKKAKSLVYAGRFQILPPIMLLSLSGQSTGQLSVEATNADGTPLDLSGRTVTFLGGNAVASVDGQGRVTALRPPLTFAETPYISATLDSMPSHNAALIRVTSDPLGIDLSRLEEPNISFYIPGQIGIHNYPEIFQGYDAARITDLGYKVEEELTGLRPYGGDIQFLINDPGHHDGTVPCGLSGNPARLGTDVDRPTDNSCMIVANPPLTPSYPSWIVFFHEMAHNFTLSDPRFIQFATGSGADGLHVTTYVEGLATGTAIYVAGMMKQRAIRYEIPDNILDGILGNVGLLGETPNLTAYVRDGAVYSKLDALDLIDILVVLGSQYGYASLYRLFSVFLPSQEPYPFSINSDVRQATFFVAAMSAATGADLRSRFSDDWGFPLDQAFYTEVYPQLSRLIAERGVSPTGTPLFVSHTDMAFGGQLVQTPSTPQAVTLYNNGLTPLALSFSASGDFAETTACTNLEAGKRCTVIVTFMPTTAGTRVGELTVTDGTGATANVTLTGTGVVPAVDLSATNLTFGEQLVESSSDPQTITLRNTGDGPLRIDSVAISPGFDESNDCGAEVAAGGSCRLSVTFGPAAIGDSQGTMTISSNAPGGPHTVALSGTGTDLALDVPSGGSSSAEVDAGDTVTYDLQLTPTGFGGIVALRCTFASSMPRGTGCSVNPASVSMNGVDPASFVVTVTTTKRSLALPLRPAPPPGTTPYLLPSLLGLFILTLAVFSDWRSPVSKQRPAVRWVPLGAMLLLVMMWAACGGGGSVLAPVQQTGTPPGTYELTVTAAADGGNRTAKLTLKVN